MRMINKKRPPNFLLLDGLLQILLSRMICRDSSNAFKCSIECVQNKEALELTICASIFSHFTNLKLYNMLSCCLNKSLLSLLG